MGWSCFLPRKGLSVFVTSLNFSEIMKQAKNKNTKSIKTWLLPVLPFLLYLCCFLHLLFVFLLAKVLLGGLRCFLCFFFKRVIYRIKPGSDYIVELSRCLPRSEKEEQRSDCCQ